MAETEDRAEEETGTSEFMEDVTTDATTDTIKYESAGDVVSGDGAERGARRDEVGRTRRKKKKRFSRAERHVNERHVREGESLWRIYMKS